MTAVRGQIAKVLLMAAALAVAARLAGQDGAARGAALTPQSPEVRQALERAAKYLETTDNWEYRVGGKALIGLAMLKNRAGKEHAVVQKVARELEESIQKKWLEDRTDASGIYSLGLCILFYAELDAEEHKPRIGLCVQELIRRQKPHGGWGYPYEELGDTSMTQLAVMGLWMAQQCGVTVPDEVLVKACNWLMRTQDVDGSFAYHPQDPGSFERVKQPDPLHGRFGVTAGGAGSLYLIENALGMSRLRLAASELPTPSGVKRVEKPDPTDQDAWRPKPAPPGLDPKRLAKAKKDVELWMSNNYTVSPTNYPHYFLYALERYETVRIATRDQPQTPRWYDDGARMLIESQQANGSWRSDTGDTSDTSFAMLFLLRSMQRSLGQVERLGDGMLVGGRGVPTNNGEVRLSMGAVVPRPLRGPAEDLLAKMEDAAAPEYLRAVQGFEELAQTADVQELNRHAVKLRELAKSQDAAARKAAVKALGRTSNLDHVPTLIYALSDPDPVIARSADDALRQLSRKFDGVGDDLDQGLTIDRWKAWYLSIRPHAEFEN